MTRILITSDSHGNVGQLLSIVKPHLHADHIIHLGDYVSDAVKVEKKLGCEIIKLKANGDFATQLPTRRILMCDGYRILLTHGHLESVKLSLLRLDLLAREEKADVVLFGHTHVPYMDFNGAMMINPGAAMLGQYGTLDIVNGQLVPSLNRL